MRNDNGEITYPFQPFGRQLDGLATAEDRLDDVGREKAEWQDPADIALIDAMTFGEITDRLDFATPDLSEPSSALRDRCDQMRVGSGRPFPFVGDDELHLHAVPLELDREIELGLVAVAARSCYCYESMTSGAVLRNTQP